MIRPAWFKHYVKRNHECQRPQNFVFVDVETSQEVVKSTPVYTKHTLKLGVACAVSWKKGREPQEQWFNFEYALHFWEWLKKWQRKKQVLWVAAHNAQFDFTILGLWKLIEDNTYATKRPGRPYQDTRTGERRMSGDWIGMLAIEGYPFHVETEGPTGRVNFTDLQNYYQSSLEQIGQSVGVPKGNFNSVRESEPELRAYCHTDVEILKRAYLGLVQLWEKEDNGNWQFSAASLAYSHFRHRYMDDSIAVHNHANALCMEWNSLYGGELRSWFRGKAPGPVLHYDVNSLYPSVMRDQVYPTALVDVVEKPNKHQFRKLVEQYAAVAEVDIATGTDRYPMRKANRIWYPIGKFTTTLAGPELMSALERGHIVGCTRIALYTYAPIFKRYVLEWWNTKSAAKRKGDIAAEKFAKLMLNSLPAKFAQRTPQWITEPKVDVVRPWKTFPWKDPVTGSIYPARSVGWIGQVCRHRVATEHAFPAIYAYVTSYAREHMRAIRAQIPPSCLYYQDTDSLMFDKQCFHSGDFPLDSIGDDIGQLRLVGEYAEATFRGPKNYTVDGRHVIAGIRKRDVEIAPMKWSAERFERLSAIFCREPDSSLRTHVVDIDTPGTDSEGGLREDGFTVPILLPPQIDNYRLVELTQSSVLPDFST